MHSSRPKIVFSSYDDRFNPFYGGGGAIAVHEIAMRLAPDFDVTVVTGNFAGAKPVEVVDGVRYQRIGPAFLGPQLGQLVFHFLLPWRVRTMSFDVWVESFTPPFSTSCLQLFTRKPVVGLAHMLAAEDMRRKYKLPFHLVENAGLKTYRQFITVTTASRDKIHSLNPQGQITVIPNGVYQHPAPEHSKDYILYMGRLEMNQKGLDLLLDAHAATSGATKLVIAGAGLPRDEQLLAQKIRDLGLTERVSVVGRVAGEQKDQLYRECRAVVVPSRLETFGMVALEALSYHKPVVCFDIEGLKWLPEDCALKATPFDAAELGQLLNRVLTEPALRTRLSTEAGRIAQAYSWDQAALQYRHVIEEAHGR